MSNNILILPGANPEHNRDWANNLTSFLKTQDSTSNIHIFQFEHWLDPSLSQSDEVETEKLANYLVNNPNTKVIAKSFGSAVVLRSLPKTKDLIFSLLLLGFPVNTSKYESRDEFAAFLKPTSFPILFTQQELDKYVHGVIVSEFVHFLNQPNISFKQIAGSDHRYDEFASYI